MTTITENDLKRLEDLIISSQKALEDRLLSAIELAKAEIKGEVKALDTKIQGLEKRFDDTNKRIDDTNKRIDDTNKRIDELSVRMNTMTVGFLSIVGVFVTGILGIIGKVVFFPNP